MGCKDNRPMNLSLSEDQTLLVDSFRRLFEAESSMERVRAAESTGSDPALWAALAEMGTFGMRLPEDGFGLLETFLAMEQAGAKLATGPVVETIVAARLLTQLGAEGLVETIVSGETVATLAPRTVEPGRLLLANGAATAHVVLIFDGRAILIQERAPTGSAPLSHAGQAVDRIDPSAGEWRPLAEGDAARMAWERAAVEWRLLTAGFLSGLARQALTSTAEYVCQREQFGRPIGSFQAIAHPLADSVTDIEGVRVLCWATIGAIARNEADGAAMVSAAWWWTAEAARTAVMRSLHSFGGYGLSNEYDIQIYHRRALAAALILGDPADELIRLGETRWLDRSCALPEVGEVQIEFGLGAEADAFADETRALLKAWDSPEWRERSHYSFEGHDWELSRKLGDEGLLYPTWPKEHGGRGLSPYVGATMYETWEEFEASTHAQAVTNMVGYMAILFGSDELKREALPRFASGNATACLGYSEPGSGTDVFAARTRAVRDGDDWIIDGQKMWTSGADLASYVLLLTRTDPDAPKHRGITMFMVPMDLPGIEVHPIRTFQDERTNTTFYTDVRVPDRYRLGEVHGGTAILGAALSLEQGGGGFVPAHRKTIEAAAEWASTTQGTNGPLIREPRVLERLARAWTRLRISDLLFRRSVWALVETPGDRSAGPMSKLFSSESFLTDATDLFKMTAPDSLLRSKRLLGTVELAHRHAAATTIYGGTSEAQRSLIAEKALGLPRSR
jgi:alkylation response protein AidB-like acyl-CoA dehydrogenase